MSKETEDALERIFSSLDAVTLRIAAREGTTVEFKETFDWGRRELYAKSISAFANNRGGYLIFGIADSPRRLVGLTGTSFDSLDEAKITEFLNSAFSPEIRYEKFSRDYAGKHVGIIYVTPCENRPVVATKNSGDIKEADIYYRYNARNDRVKYPELKAMFDHAREAERKAWMELFQRVSKIGPENTGVMDMADGTIEGEKGTLLIDAGLLPKLRFINAGTFAQSGRPVLKLIGDVRPVAVTDKGGTERSVRLTDDPNAPAIREDTLLGQYPMNYGDLLKELAKRYQDFKQNEAFHRIRRPLKQNSKYCHTRYADPRQKKLGKDFYSKDIFVEFDKHYKKR